MVKINILIYRTWSAPWKKSGGANTEYLVYNINSGVAGGRGKFPSPRNPGEDGDNPGLSQQ